jgi:hypothetical protein
LTLENAVAIVSSLRDEQLSHFGSFLQDTGVYLHTSGFGARGGFEQEGNREVLRTFGALLPRQQEVVRAGGQIAFAQMPPLARQWLLAAAELQRRELRAFGLPPGELPPGLLSLEAVTVQREVTSVGDDQVRSILRALDGPRAGQQVGSMSQGGSLPPGLSVGGQVFQQLTWRYQYAETSAWTLDLSLPWVHLDPSVKLQEPARSNAGGAPQRPREP